MTPATRAATTACPVRSAATITGLASGVSGSFRAGASTCSASCNGSCLRRAISSSSSATEGEGYSQSFCFAPGTRSSCATPPSSLGRCRRSRERHPRVSKRFGRFHPLRLDPPIFDETGGRLFLRFHESWRGGTFTGVKQPDGSWMLLPGSFWIS